jgi:hypothetical protein
MMIKRVLFLLNIGLSSFGFSQCIHELTHIQIGEVELRVYDSEVFEAIASMKRSVPISRDGNFNPWIDYGYETEPLCFIELDYYCNDLSEGTTIIDLLSAKVDEITLLDSPFYLLITKVDMRVYLNSIFISDYFDEMVWEFGDSNKVLFEENLGERIREEGGIIVIYITLSTGRYLKVCISTKPEYPDQVHKEYQRKLENGDILMGEECAYPAEGKVYYENYWKD